MRTRCGDGNMTLDITPKKINIFVGNDVRTISDVINASRANPKNYLEMHLGSLWNHGDIETNLHRLFTTILPYWARVNSLEVLQTIPDAVNYAGLEEDFQLIRIGRSARTSNYGEVIATHHTFDELVMVIEAGVDIR